MFCTAKEGYREVIDHPSRPAIERERDICRESRSQGDCMYGMSSPMRLLLWRLVKPG